MSLPEGRVDDFLGLGEEDLGRVRTLVLHGRSGSGKSTLLRHLLRSHPAYRGEDAAVLPGPPFDAGAAAGLRGRLVLVDEVHRWGELGVLLGLLGRGCRLLVASHLPGWAHLPLRLMGPLRIRATDRDPAKLGRYLAARGIRADDAALATYVRRYRATFTDLDILLERCPAKDLGVAMARFHRRHRIDLEPASVPEGEAAEPPGRG